MHKSEVESGKVYCDKWANLFLVVTTRLVASRSSVGRGPYQLAAHPGQRATRYDRHTGRTYGYLVLCGYGGDLDALEMVDAAGILEALERGESLPTQTVGYYKLIYTFTKFEGPARQILAQWETAQRTRREMVAAWMQEERYAIQGLNEYLPADKRLKPGSYPPDREPVIHLSLETVRLLLQGFGDYTGQRVADAVRGVTDAQLAMIDAGELVYYPSGDEGD